MSVESGATDCTGARGVGGLGGDEGPDSDLEARTILYVARVRLPVCGF